MFVEKHRENTGNLVCSSCKFPDSKGKRYFEFRVCNSHKTCKLAQGKFAVRQGKLRENTRNLKMKFELLL